jgi:hypothetical protein
MRKTPKNQLEINTKFSIAKNALLVNTTVHVPRTEQKCRRGCPAEQPCIGKQRSVLSVCEAGESEGIRDATCLRETQFSAADIVCRKRQCCHGKEWEIQKLNFCKVSIDFFRKMCYNVFECECFARKAVRYERQIG